MVQIGYIFGPLKRRLTPILLMTKKLHYLPFNTVRSGMDKAR